ncbi:MAG: hypothetical protein CMH54_14385 [Myxococcales bacterium]|nr:hypothetical protein [Myxococcales bacterium]
MFSRTHIVLVLIASLMACATTPEAELPYQTGAATRPAENDVQDPNCSDRDLPFGCLYAIPAGRFLMGAQATDAQAPGYDPAAEPHEAPARHVEVGAFHMHVWEVMAWQYKRCVLAGACKLKDVQTDGYFYSYGKATANHPTLDDRPINGVNWFGARDYCAWIGARLPTEAEWEYAARGPESRRYPWGQKEATYELAVFGEKQRTSGVSLDPRAEGQNWIKLFHLAGNVWEWTADWYAPDAYAKAAPSNPRGPENGSSRVIRGGGWADEAPTDLRSSGRAAMPPQIKAHDIGFRCVRPAKTPAQ